MALTRPTIRGIAAACFMAALCLTPSSAQTQVSAGMDRATARARTLMESGEGTAARTVLDSLVESSSPSSLDLAEALYWRAVLAERVMDAERDWKRLVIEVPLSPHTPDALLRLGELDLLRGRPAGARVYLDRLVRDYPEGTHRPRALLLSARSFLEERDMIRGCELLTSLRTAGIAQGEVSLQADELARSCGNTAVPVATAAPPAREPVKPAVVSAPPETPPADVTPPEPTESTGRFSVQLAAFNTKREAEAAVKRFAARGVAARIDGTVKPFRVRTGRFAQQTEAAAFLAKLKRQGYDGFVAEITP